MSPRTVLPLYDEIKEVKNLLLCLKSYEHYQRKIEINTKILNGGWRPFCKITENSSTALVIIKFQINFLGENRI